MALGKIYLPLVDFWRNRNLEIGLMDFSHAVEAFFLDGHSRSLSNFILVFYLFFYTQGKGMTCS